MDNTRVGVIGVWHLGSVVSACFADLGYRVVGYDGEPAGVELLNQGIPPVYEPGLEEVLRRNLSTGRLAYTTNLRKAVLGSEYILITYDTPVDEQDEVDLSQLFEVASAMASGVSPEAAVVVQSQIPVSTCARLEERLREAGMPASVPVIYVPENLRLGQAIERFMRPAMVVIGAEESKAFEKAERLYSVIQAPKIHMDRKTAEMTKHALNAYLATMISFINEIANLCERAGADALKVADALRHDERVSAKAPLQPGLGFSGGTLARDLKVLMHLARSTGYDPHLLSGVLAANDYQMGVILRKLLHALGSLQGRTVTILGLTYKSGTDTLRRSMALDVIQELVRQGAKVKAYDPKVNPEQAKAFPIFDLSPDAYDAAKGSDALVILTDWPEFTTLDYKALKGAARTPVLLDARNTLEPAKMTSLGFRYLGIGR